MSSSGCSEWTASSIVAWRSPCGVRKSGLPRRRTTRASCPPSTAAHRHPAPARSRPDRADARRRRWVQAYVLSLYMGPEAAAQLALVTLGLRRRCARFACKPDCQACDQSFGTPQPRCGSGSAFSRVLLRCGVQKLASARSKRPILHPTPVAVSTSTRSSSDRFAAATSARRGRTSEGVTSASALPRSLPSHRRSPAPASSPDAASDTSQYATPRRRISPPACCAERRTPSPSPRRSDSALRYGEPQYNAADQTRTDGAAGRGRAPLFRVRARARARGLRPRATCTGTERERAHRALGRQRRRECLDRLLIFSRRRLEHVVRIYVRHYNEHRPHRSLDLEAPDPQNPVVGRRTGSLTEVRRRDRLGGLIHEYETVAASHRINAPHACQRRPTSNAATASADSSTNTAWPRETEFTHPTGCRN
jgi:hypothetical protein